MKNNPFVYISLIAVFLFSNIAFGDMKKNSGLQHENYKKITLEQKNNQMNLLGLSKPSSGPTKIDAIKKDKFYQINSDKVFLNEALRNIENEPGKYFVLFLKKVISFLFIDINSSYPNYYNIFHYLPLLLIGFSSLIGIVLSNNKSKELNYLILVFFINIIIFSCFFILPRYKLIILPMQLIFTNILISFIYKKFFNRQ